MSDREHGFVQRKNYIPYIVRDIQTTHFNKVWICLFMKYKNLLSIILLYLYWHVQLLSLHQRKLGNFMVIHYFHCSYFSTNKVLSNMYKDRIPSVQSIEELNALCIDDKPVEKKIRIPAKSEFSSAVTYDPIVQ